MPKTYRIKEIDEPLRRHRTRREAKVLEKLPRDMAPLLLRMDDKEMVLEMEYLEGEKLADILDKMPDLAGAVGANLARMHNMHIIHGDPTTSNMIFKHGKVYFIDFGLSFFSHKVEDKAVDLHVLCQTLGSRHHKVFNEAYNNALREYKLVSNDYKEIIHRLEKVEKRGRHKQK